MQSKSKKPVAIVVGASCRALAESLFAAGFEITALDFFADRDLKEIAECISISSFDDELNLNLLPTHGTLFLGGGTEHLGRLVRSLADRYPLAGPSLDQITQLRDRSSWTRWASVSGIAFPVTFTPGEWMRMTVLDRKSKRWLAKPIASGGGLGIAEIQTDDDLRFSSDKRNDYLVQEWIKGESISAIYLANGREVCSMATFLSITEKQWDATTPFLYRGSFGPVQFSDSVQSKLQAYGETVFQELPWRGWIQADFIVDSANHLHLLEINPRWSASMELWERSANSNLARWWLDSEGCLPTAGSEPILKVIVYAKKAFLVDQLWSDKLLNMRFENRHRNMGIWAADIPTPGAPIPEGGPICSLMTRSPELEQGLARLRSVLSDG